MNANLFQHLSDSVAETSKIAIEAGATTYTYEDLILLSGRIANALVELGVNPGDRVAVQVEKSVEALILYLACLRAGAVYLPLNTAYTLAELEYFIGDAEPALVSMATLLVSATASEMRWKRLAFMGPKLPSWRQCAARAEASNGAALYLPRAARRN